MLQIPVPTHNHSEFLDITHLIDDAIKEQQVDSGIVTVFVAHTTAGITINENADPDVRRDLLQILERLVPWNDQSYRHFEGNTAAHLKASLMGSSVQVIIEGGRLQLGTWQGVYFCEFDGPRQRHIGVKIIADRSVS